MKKGKPVAVLKERLCIAAMLNCRAGGTRRTNMKTLAQHVGVFRDDADLETSLCAYIKEKIGEQHARRFLTWMITKASYAGETAKPPICIPKCHQLALEVQ